MPKTSGDTLPKVLVIGLDGATFDLIKPWAAAGKLPNLARILMEGCHGELQSTMQPLSPHSWVSFQTGANPGKHGVFDFSELRLDKSYTPISSEYIAGNPFWEIVGENGKKVGIMGVLGTYPVKPVNGFLITGMISPKKGILSYPPDLLKEIKDRCGDYIIDIDFSKEGFKKLGLEGYIAEITNMTKLRIEAAKYLLCERQWDLFVVVFGSPDRIQNFFWKYIDDSRTDVSDEERSKYGDVILQVYQQIDDFIGDIQPWLTDNTTTIIVSDHGFGPMYKDVNLNRWLYEQGFLQLKESRKLAKILRFLKHTARNMMPVQVRCSIRKNMLKVFKPPTLCESLPFDWSRTKVYTLGDFGNLYMNLKGREPYGIVKPGAEYEHLRKTLIERLLAWTNPETKKPVVKKVYKREEIYHGPNLERAPDLVIEWYDYAYLSFHATEIDKPMFCTPREYDDYGELEFSGNHRPMGILMIKGPHICEGKKIEKASIMDIAPTILYLMGQKIPLDMDGRVLLDCFSEYFLAEHPLVYDNQPIGIAETTEDKGVYSNQEAAKIKEQLKGLGYM